MESANKIDNGLKKNDLISWLRLIRSENVGPSTFHDLVSHFGSASEALYNLPEIGKRSKKGRAFRVCSVERAEQEIEKHEGLSAKLITINDSLYPEILSKIDDAPPIISVIGNPLFFLKKSISIVGSRNASIHGKNLALFLFKL